MKRVIMALLGLRTLRLWKSLLLLAFHVTRSSCAFFKYSSFECYFSSLLITFITGIFSKIPCSSFLYFLESDIY